MVSDWPDAVVRHVDAARWARVGGWRTGLYSSSLGLVMRTVFMACWLVLSVASQSELVAVGSMAVHSIYLRRRGSPESKAVGTSHATGVAG